MTIIQITDLHINIPSENPFKVDCLSSFSRVLNDSIHVYDPDLVVISGDLCMMHPDKNVYLLVKQLLDRCGKPFKVISGNHDNPEFINEIFYNGSYGAEEVYFDLQNENKNIIFLDTTKGIMSQEQYEWLRTKISESTGDILIFMHHPPLNGSVLHMDLKYSFREIDKFTSLLSDFHDRKFFIFTGHYHNERTIVSGNKSVFITPSTFVQINDVKSEMEVSHKKPAYRVIRVENQNLTTFVNYLDL